MTKIRSALIAIGWVVWTVGNVYLIYSDMTIGLVLSFIGLALTMGGFAIWAELKGRSPVWMLLAILSPLGIIPMLFLKSKRKQLNDSR